MGVQPQSVPAIQIGQLPRTEPLEITTPRSQFDCVGRQLEHLRSDYLKKIAYRRAKVKTAASLGVCLADHEIPADVVFVEPSDSSKTESEDQTQMKYIIACIEYLLQQVDYLKQYRYAQKSLEQEKVYCSRISNYIILQYYVENAFIDEFVEIQQRQFGDMISADYVEEAFLRLLRGEDAGAVAQLRNNSSRDCLFL